IHAARAEFPNTLLLDAGDTIQGTALADYQALVDPLECGESQAMFRARDALDYDAAAIGNHEFNYGLEFLSRATGVALNVKDVAAKKCTGGPDFPLVLSNVISENSDEPLFPPFVILERTLHARDEQGKPIEAPIRIAVLGFAPPGIMQWDKRHLDGRARTEGVLEAARRHLPAVMRERPDLVLALSHGGIDARDYKPTMENAGWHLAALPEIDALLLGHSHAAFPDPGNLKSIYAGLPEVDAEQGLLRGKPAVMASFWGKSLGVIRLALRHDGARWRVDPDASRSELRPIAPRDGVPVAADPGIAPLVATEHAQTLKYLATPIGRSDFVMSSYFVPMGDVSSLQLVNAAQRDYVERYVRDNLPGLAHLPVLSAAAPFKTGFGGPTDYTLVPAGPLSIRNASDLYLYPNSVAAIELDGAALKAWLERSAARFNRIDPSNPNPQELLDPKFVGYNFDVIEGGIDYTVDVTQPQGERIVKMSLNGKPVSPQDRFIVATNNYRANSRSFGGNDGSRVLFTAPDSNRDVLIAWIRAHPEIRRDDARNARSWRFARVTTRGPVTFVLPAGLMPRALDAGLAGIREESPLDGGLARYTIDLASPH
ncbi:MAG: bifunctional 2',3'-cyclic-nucleotide 2'-phosphodiesterase/3'-nucleotidase, partial [Lysobacterales bacterium]